MEPHAGALNNLLTTLDRLNMEAQQLMAVVRACGFGQQGDKLRMMARWSP
jgi:hypothetical protein